MKLIRYQVGEATQFGYLDGDWVGPIVGDVFGAFTRGARQHRLSDVALLAPCVPSKIIALGHNFLDKLSEGQLAVPAMPLIFFKPSTSVIGPGEAITLPPQSQKVEFSAELAVVMGKRARWVSAEQASAYILGYTCANDVTARDIVEAEGVWARGKAFDTFCPLGPTIQTQFDPAEALITCRLNGQTRQMTSTHDMLFTVAQAVAFVSASMTLLPGDVILMGTPAGAGELTPGDLVEVDIEGIGVLRNPAQAETHRPEA